MPDTTESDSFSRLAQFPENGKPAGSRLKDAPALQSVYWQMRQDDQLSAHQRFGIRQQINGAPPFVQSAKKKAGGMGGSNLNFGAAKARIRQSLTVYYDMLDSLKAFIAPEIPIDLYDDTTRQNAEDVIAEEFTTMFRDWNDFPPRLQLLAKEFVEHGVGLAHFPKDRDWKFDTCGLDNFLIPRDTRNSEEFVDILMQTKDEIPSALYRMIENEKAATDAGWNVQAVKKALVRATRYTGKPLPQNWGLEWDKLSQMIKGNDIGSSYSTTARVFLVHGWVREFDGSFSHYICERNPKGTEKAPGDDFLYKKISRFPPDSNCFTIFCLDVGNGYYHSIRGQGYDQFAHVQTLNKMLNDLVNTYRLGTTTMLQKSNANSLDESPIVISNGMAIISPDVEYVEKNLQDHTRTTMPVLNFFNTNLDGVSPVLQGGTENPNDPVMTKYQLQSKQSTGSALNTASVNMFNRSWKRLLRESWRRIQDIIREELHEPSGPDEDDAEFPEVGEFVTRCGRRGITVDMILAVERVNEVRAIGAGAPGMQQSIMDRLMQMAPGFDERGLAMVRHDAVTLLVGNRRAQRYCPLQDKARPVIDQGFAQLENALMYGGGSIDPLDGQNHAVHAMVHMGPSGSNTEPTIADSIQVLENWRNNGEQGDITDLQPHIAFLSLIIPHCEQHVQALARDPMRAPQVANMKKGLQEYAAIWMTYVRQITAALEDQQANEEKQAQPDPLKLQKIAESQQKMQLAERAFQSTEQLKVADVVNRMTLRKRQADVDTAIKINKANGERIATIPTADPMAQELPPASQSDDVTNRTAHTPLV